MHSSAILIAVGFCGALFFQRDSCALAQDADALKGAAHQSDWTQWGGNHARMNTPVGRNTPTQWSITELDRNNLKRGQHPVGSKNIKWAVPLGTETYSNPIVAGGKVFVGTNNGAGYLDRYPPNIDLGVLLCFEEETGNFLWQHANQKLITGRVHDWPNQGVCSTPVVIGNRLWYVSNRGEIVCLDTEGHYDNEDDGPEQDFVPLLELDAYVHGQLRNWNRDYNTPISIRKEFTRLGLQLPNSFGLTTGDDKRSWSVVEHVYDSKSRTVNHTPIYRIVWEGEFLRVDRSSLADGQVVYKELFRVADQLIAELGTPRVVANIEQELKAHGVAVDMTFEPQTLVEGKQWSFRGAIGGKKRQFLVRLQGPLLRVEMPRQNTEKEDADVVWRFDMMQELGVSQHNMANCSMLVVDGVLFACTSNGVDESHNTIPSPNAPSFIAIESETGNVVWTDNSPGENILHAQWASPSYGVFGGQPQVIFPGGDGWLYSFDPKGDGKGGAKLLWKFDCNPKTTVYALGGMATRNSLIAFPAIYDGLVYIAVGDDPEHGEGDGHLWCIDPTMRLDGGDVSPELAVDKQGNVLAPRRLRAIDEQVGERAIPNPDSAVVWHYDAFDQNHDGKFDFEETFHRSISTPVIQDDILYTADFSGLLHCLHAKTGQVFWTYDCFATCWSSPMLVDGKIYIADEDGDVSIFRHTATPKAASFTSLNRASDSDIEQLNQKLIRDGVLISVCNCSSAFYTTPIVANNVLYIARRNALYAIEDSSK